VTEKYDSQLHINARTNMHTYLNTRILHAGVCVHTHTHTHTLPNSDYMCTTQESGVNAYQYTHYLQCFTKIAKYYSSFQYLV